MSFPGFGTWIERRAIRSPADPALIAAGVTHRYRDLASLVRSIAAVLGARGIEPGDRVAYHGGNDVVGLASLFATTAVGAVWVPVHPGRPDDEVRAVLEDADPRLLIRGAPQTHPATRVPEIEADDLRAGSDADPLPALAPQPEDLAMLAYTSGTTGPPKGVMLSHANLLWTVIQMVTACSLSPEDVVLAAAPFTRLGGLGVTVLPALFTGASVVVPDAADGASVLETIQRFAVSVVFANPGLLDAMARAPGWRTTDLSSVRTGVVGGGLVPEPLLRSYLDRGVRLRHGYGLTEAGPVVSLLDQREAATRLGSVGRPLPFVEVRATRLDGSPAAADEIGAWWVRGPNVSSGYWRRPPVLDDGGWFPTGDVGAIDADGYLTFVDRASSAMNVGGEVIYPAVIERALYGLSGVEDAAAVDLDGVITVAIVGETAPSRRGDVLTHAREAVRPSSPPLELRSVTSIPRNAAGKVKRGELRARLRA
jgi:acyl-CoA synthetase (AMP-forming)/AMP-acid ligase II